MTDYARIASILTEAARRAYEHYDPASPYEQGKAWDKAEAALAEILPEALEDRTAELEGALREIASASIPDREWWADPLSSVQTHVHKLRRRARQALGEASARSDTRARGLDLGPRR